MNINFNNNIPIYIQIIEYIKIRIICGEYKLGVRLPSVREYACILKVNPNTIVKAMDELENMKLIYTERTNGKYVTSDDRLIIKYRDAFAKEETQKYIRKMKEMNINLNEIIELIKKESNK